jgi:hypothetical protein
VGADGAVTTRNDNDSAERGPVSTPRPGAIGEAPTNLADLIANIMDPLGGVELDIPPRARTGPFAIFDAWPDDEERADA